MNKDDEYQEFVNTLESLRKAGIVKVLKRGVTKEFAFTKLGLNPELNNLQEFGERLFYFGEKSRYFWEKKVDNAFKFGDTDPTVFEYIFERFKCISSMQSKVISERKENYISKNISVFGYFLKETNKKSFLDISTKMDFVDKRRYINYYLRILHQIGDPDYKEKSINISSTESERTAKWFAKNQIIIDFWDFEFNNFEHSVNEMPHFKGKPYKNQKEITVLGVIFPHFIHSFRYAGNIYYNPAISKSTDYISMIRNGFDIDQTDFNMKMNEKTIYNTALTKKDSELNETVQ